MRRGISSKSRNFSCDSRTVRVLRLVASTEAVSVFQLDIEDSRAGSELPSRSSSAEEKSEREDVSADVLECKEIKVE